MTLEGWVREFADNVAAQTDAIWQGDAKAGNRRARKYISAFEQLRAHGDAGREALTVPFSHPRMDVRVMAAAYLLRYRTHEAREVLMEAARGEGFVPFKAGQTLKRWDEGTWALDPK
ncbi:DUF2019 domain-containing protein [Corallococcus exiguus]|uniref:DUF2019 domain-containing protein n=1 Tax=Corallococcus TaxID=83461 RepID=UPI000EA355C8|nr:MULTISPECIES: DUF2019 domain-containing protein [Corallococcus]NRD65825.1 DUF2019 domain-containing protein [Corallococcus exiguus]RKH27287.1 DUF2019 domain-containing protein [Corallococcus sp. CA041A]